MAWTLKLLVATLVVYYVAAGEAELVEPTISPDSPTTDEGPGSATTEGPGSPTTDEGPGSPTTDEGPGSATTKGPGSPTTDKGPGPSPTPDTTVPVTTEAPDICLSLPCKGGSTCHPRANQTFVCLCLRGDYYDNVTEACSTAKVFPGELAYNKPYSDALGDKKSMDFLQASNEVVHVMNTAFMDEKDYKQSTVLEFRPKSLRNQGVIASIEIILSANSNATESYVETRVESAIEDSVLPGAVFTGKTLCDDSRNPCHKETSKCMSGGGLFNCTCLADYIPVNYTNRLCVACPSGKKPDDFGTCEDCAFGKSGFNCDESWELILVIVGSLLGGLLLITIILLPIVARKSSKKTPKKIKEVESGKSDMNQMSRAPAPMAHTGFPESRPFPAQGGSSNGLAAFASAGVPRIPRAVTTSGYDRGSNLEMTPSSSRQNLISGGRNTRLYEDADYTSENVYNRSQGNAYSQNRQPYNPYGQSQGQSNPYYTGDSGRRY